MRYNNSSYCRMEKRKHSKPRGWLWWLVAGVDLSMVVIYDIIGLNTLRSRQNGRHFPDDIFKLIFLIKNVCISTKISLKFVPQVPINNIPALVQIIAWHRSGDKALSEPMMDNFLTHICVTRPQWVNFLSGPSVRKCNLLNIFCTHSKPQQ